MEPASSLEGLWSLVSLLSHVSMFISQLSDTLPKHNVILPLFYFKLIYVGTAQCLLFLSLMICLSIVVRNLNGKFETRRMGKLSADSVMTMTFLVVQAKNIKKSQPARHSSLSLSFLIYLFIYFKKQLLRMNSNSAFGIRVRFN